MKTTLTLSFGCASPCDEKLARLFPEHHDERSPRYDPDTQFSRQGRFWWDASFLLEESLRDMGLTVEHAYAFDDGSMYKYVQVPAGMHPNTLQVEIDDYLQQHPALETRWFVSGWWPYAYKKPGKQHE